jgi:hypothetical protein
LYHIKYAKKNMKHRDDTLKICLSLVGQNRHRVCGAGSN